MTQLNNGVLDPEGLISMNTRYKVENQDMTFGFEDIFAYDNQAGGDRYTKQILFKTY
jgi:predicted RecB family endonuclease